MPPAEPSIVWSEWSQACGRARELERPVLLLLETHWSRASLAPARVLEDPASASDMRGGFVASKVDAERRPDLADRYGFGEWPSAAFLTSAGTLFGGGAPRSASELLDLLRKVDAAWHSRRSEIERTNRAAPERGEPGEPGELEEPGEPGEPGERGEPREPDEIRVLLGQRDQASARAALDRLVADLIDPDDGGVVRRAGAPEKLLHANADVLDLLEHAGAILADARYLDTARRLAAFVRSRLELPGGGFGASVGPCGLDTTLLTDANAAMVASMVRAGALLEQPELTESAIASLERIVLATYKPGDGVGHVAGDPAVRGLLTDHIWLATALLDAHEATARQPYEMLAEELLHYCCRVLWDQAGDGFGGFLDRAEPGDPLKPFALNCRAARALARAADVSGEPLFADRARGTLAALADGAPAHGADAAAFALAHLKT